MSIWWSYITKTFLLLAFEAFDIALILYLSNNFDCSSFKLKFIDEVIS